MTEFYHLAAISTLCPFLSPHLSSTLGKISPLYTSIQMAISHLEKSSHPAAMSTFPLFLHPSLLFYGVDITPADLEGKAV